MTTSRPHSAQSSRSPGIEDEDLAAVLHGAARQAMGDLCAVAAAVHLLNSDGTRLELALTGGTPPSLFMVPGQVRLDSGGTCARALASGEAAVSTPADTTNTGGEHALPHPYTALSVPIASDGRRFGTMSVLCPQTPEAFGPAERERLQRAGDRLGTALAELAGRGTAVTAGPMPALVPIWPGTDLGGHTPGWGVPGAPGSAGTSMMYPVRRLTELLNRATTPDDIVEAAQRCLMAPFGARALALVTADQGHLWVLGHSGASSGLVRHLHGARTDTRSPVTEALHGLPQFLAASGPPAVDSGRPDGRPHTEAHLPLPASTRFGDLAAGEQQTVIGVCCLSFPDVRAFSTEERAILGMMAQSLGAAVERVELGSRQREVAECLQRTRLPSTLPELPRLTTAARYWPATATSKVGGDWYDVIPLPGERMALVVGDVEGHSMESAAVMGQVRTAVAAYASEDHPPATVIDRVGRLLITSGTELTVTCCVVVLDTGDGTAQLALAGHPSPLVRRADGSVGALEAPANVPLGVAIDGACQGREHRVEAGSILMLYSNGLVDWDATTPEERARELLGSGVAATGSDLEQLADHISADVSHPQQRRDDAVLLMARYEGAGRAGSEAAPRAGGLVIQRGDLQGAGAARAFVDDRLHTWGLPDLSDSLQLIASEMVTNALIHAGSDVDVRLRAFDDHVRLEVRDSRSNPPVPSPLALSEEDNAEAEHGRGLLIVDALGGVWNSFPNGRGKNVVVDMPLEMPF
ncbi:SpoIIE family protein phosphatase [Streptomyces sp. NPDC001595]|uniref:SpoIIE family protein phosphatase n=1 Tax=Streptomyces sp. NPDC001532 TaxID=3154520 RepID=UPI0033260C70